MRVLIFSVFFPFLFHIICRRNRQLRSSWLNPYPAHYIITYTITAFPLQKSHLQDFSPSDWLSTYSLIKLSLSPILWSPINLRVLPAHKLRIFPVTKTPRTTSLLLPQNTSSTHSPHNPTPLRVRIHNNFLLHISATKVLSNVQPISISSAHSAPTSELLFPLSQRCWVFFCVKVVLLKEIIGTGIVVDASSYHLLGVRGHYLRF